MSEQHSPLFAKSYDFLLWLLNHTERFPKSERFRMARRLEDTAFGFYDQLLRAAKSDQKIKPLTQADYELDRLRLYVRLSHARGLTGLRQYQYAAELLSEIGRLLGGWMRSTKAATGR